MTPESESAARNRARAIVACADRKIRQLLTSVLSEFRLHPILPETLDEAKRLIIQEETAIAFVQPRFSDGTFREVLGAAECPKSHVPVIVCSEFYDINIHTEAMSMGAFDYLAFPFRREEGALGKALLIASRTMRRCTFIFLATPAIVPTPNSYSRRISSNSSTLTLHSNGLPLLGNAQFRVSVRCPGGPIKPPNWANSKYRNQMWSRRRKATSGKSRAALPRGGRFASKWIISGCLARRPLTSALAFPTSFLHNWRYGARCFPTRCKCWRIQDVSPKHPRTRTERL